MSVLVAQRQVAQAVSGQCPVQQVPHGLLWVKVHQRFERTHLHVHLHGHMCKCVYAIIMIVVKSSIGIVTALYERTLFSSAFTATPLL